MREETAKTTTLHDEIESLRHLTAGRLREKYLEVFGEESRSGHKQFLFRRIAWRIQANALGGLSERARQRALEIADDADLRIRAPKNFLQMPLDETRTSESRCLASADPRLPLDGSDLKRHFRGKDIVVRVREEGFEHGGRLYPSLSAAVRAATGTRWNGFAFFALGNKPGAKRGEYQQ